MRLQFSNIMKQIFIPKGFLYKQSKKINMAKIKLMATLLEQKYDFWKNNKIENHFQLTGKELQTKFAEWLETKDKDYIDSYNYERIMRFFIALDENGLVSVFDENQIDDIYDLLRLPIDERYEAFN